MKLNTTIVIPKVYENNHKLYETVKEMDDILYNVIIGQQIRISGDELLLTKVTGVDDYVYKYGIHRYIEVELIEKF